MNKKYVVAIIVAAAVIVGLVILIPLLTGDGDTATTPLNTSDTQAPPISPDATLPPNHPSVDGSAGDTTGTTVAGAVDPNAALAAAEAKYKANPKDIAVLVELGNAYAQANRAADAERIFKEAQAIDPDNNDVRVGLAMVALANGDVATAQKELEVVVAAEPDNQAARYNLAVAFFSANQRDKAKAEWEKVVAIDPASEYGGLAQQFLTLMETGGGSGENPHSAGTTAP